MKRIGKGKRRTYKGVCEVCDCEIITKSASSKYCNICSRVVSNYKTNKANKERAKQLRKDWKALSKEEKDRRGFLVAMKFLDTDDKTYDKKLKERKEKKIEEEKIRHCIACNKILSNWKKNKSDLCNSCFSKINNMGGTIE